MYYRALQLVYVVNLSLKYWIHHKRVSNS